MNIQFCCFSSLIVWGVFFSELFVRFPIFFLHCLHWILLVVLLWWCFFYFYFFLFFLLCVPLWLLFLLLLLFLLFFLLFCYYYPLICIFCVLILCTLRFSVHPFDCMISFHGFCVKISSFSLMLFYTSSDHLSQFSWIVSFFNIPLICFSVDLFLYFSYPHLEIVPFFFCFSIDVMNLSFSSIELRYEYVFLLFSKLNTPYYLLSSIIVFITVDKSLLFVRT